MAEFPAAVVEQMIHRVSIAYTSKLHISIQLHVLHAVIAEHIGVIEKKCLEHHSMLSTLQDPSNGATALKHIKQQVRKSHSLYCVAIEA